MNTITEFKTNFVENLEQTIFEVTANYPITRLYLSIGSKLNELVIADSQYEQWYSNALHQMFPEFLQNNSYYTEDATFIIIIDRFTDFEYRRNELLLRNRLKKSKHTHIVILNTLCDEKLLVPLIKYITYICGKTDMLSRNLLICNYVKFSSTPNYQEYQQSFFISSFIDKLLSKTKHYKECLYEWFGYDYSLFNMIYNYKLSQNMYDNNGYKILKKILHNLPSNDIYQTNINNMEVRNFCKCILDIRRKRPMNNEIFIPTVYDCLQ